MLDPIKNLAETLIKAEEFSTIEWLICQSGNTLSKGFVKSKNSKFSHTGKKNPIYRIYSMTKPIVSFATLIGVEQNKIKLYDNVSTYIDSFKNVKVLSKNGCLQDPMRPITIEDLLTHRSGLSYGFNRFCPVGQKYAQDGLINKNHLNLADFVDKIAEFPIAFEPGTAWRYSVSTDVLARVLEIVFEDGIENILKNCVFNQLDMNDTDFYVPNEKLPRLVPMSGDPNLDKITDINDIPPDLTETNMDGFYPSDRLRGQPRGGHGLFSTVADYQKFAKLLLNGETTSGKRIISPAMLHFSLQNRISREQMPLYIDTIPQNGYGWSLLGRIMENTSKSLTLANKGEHGWAGAATTYFWVDPQYDLTGVVMSQLLGSRFSLGEEIRSKTYTLIP